MDPIGEIYPIARSLNGRFSTDNQGPSKSVTESSSSAGKISMDHSDVEKANVHSPGATTEQTPSQLDWDGSDDPDNPHNWSHSKRGCVTIVVGLVGFAV